MCADWYQDCVVKLSKDGDSLAYEQRLLQYLKTHGRGLFAAPLLKDILCLTGSDRDLVAVADGGGAVPLSEHARFRADCFTHAMALERGTVNFKDVVRTGGLGVNEQRVMAERAVKIVEAAHGAGLVLVDFKLANIVKGFRRESDGDHVTKYVDLDSALLRDQLLPEAVGATMTTMAPELLQARRFAGQVASPRIDLWSLALVLFEIVTGASFWEACFGISEYGADSAACIEAKLAELAADQCLVDDALSRFFAGSGRDSLPLRQLSAVLLDLLRVNPAQRKLPTDVLQHSLFAGVVSASSSVADSGSAAAAAAAGLLHKDLLDLQAALGSRLDRGFRAVGADIRDAVVDMVQASGGGGAANS